MPRTDRRIIFSGIFEINTRASVPISKKVKETALRQKNELIINRIESTSFTRPSRWCTQESEG